jgi:hypothetical protein
MSNSAPKEQPGERAMLRLVRSVAFAIRLQLKKQKRPGEATSTTAPYGFRVKRRRGRRYFVPDEYELTVMRRCYELYKKGYPYDSIRQFFREKGIRSRRNGELGNRQLLEMNRRYTAMMARGELPDAWKPRTEAGEG